MSTAPNTTETIIAPPKGRNPINFQELWSYRELLIQLVWRDISVRYKQTALGLMWAVLNPVLTAIIFSIIFGMWARIPTDGIPYPAFFLAGMSFWAFFASALSGSSGALVSQRALLTKVYFPRLLAPLAAIAPPLVDLVVALLVLLVVVLFYGFIPNPWVLVILPGAILWTLVGGLGLGLWFASMNVRYRDVGQLVPFVVRVGMFASPVIYPVSMIPEKWRLLYGLNPVVGAIEWSRWALFGGVEMPSPALFVSIPVALVLLITGVFAFRRMEDTFVDVV